MINPQIALMGRQQDSFSALDGGLKMGQGLRQLVVGREIGNMNQIDDENERKAFANKSMFSRELNAQIKADASAKQKAMYDQLKTEAEIAKTASEAGKNNAQAGGFNLDNSGKLLTSANQALMVAARTGDPMAAKLALSNAFKAGAINQDVFDQYNKQIDVLGTQPEALKQFVGGITWANAKDPASLMFTTADNVLDNETSIANNRLTNQTSENNNIRTTDASRYSTDKTYETNEHRLNQDQNQFNMKFEFDQQQADIRNRQVETKEHGGFVYLVDKQGQARKMVDENGQYVKSTPKSEPSIRTGIADLTGANDQTNMAIDALGRALDLSEQGIYDGYLANARSDFAGNFGGTEESRRTQEYSNIITNSALQSLKSVFGGSPTEGERAMLLKIQASAEYPKETRKAILNEAILMAQKKIESNNKQMKILGGGSQQFAPQAQPQAQEQGNRLPLASLFE